MGIAVETGRGLHRRATAPARRRSASSAPRSPSGCGRAAIRSAGACSTGSATQPTWVTIVGRRRRDADDPHDRRQPQRAVRAAGAVRRARGAGPGREGRRRRRRRCRPCARSSASSTRASPSAGSTTLDAVVAGAVAEPLRLRFFLSILGGLALVIGAVGIYSVVSYSVTRRRAEFGVRLALGAAPRRILSEVVTRRPGPGGGRRRRRAGRDAGARVDGRSVPLRRRSRRRRQSRIVAAAALMAAGLVAAVVPGLRAGRTDPVTALRAD